MSKKSRQYLFLIAISALLAGFVFYFLFRRIPIMMAISAYIPAWTHINASPSLGAAAINSVPSFIHVFSFSILSALAFGTLTLRVIIGCCFVWTLTNIVFEIGQIITSYETPTLTSYTYTLIPSPVSEYFINGTFDWWDIAFSVFGGVAALLLMRHYLGNSNVQCP